MIIDYEADRRLIKRVASLRPHWRWLLEGACGCAAAALIVSLFLPKIYRATTYVLVSESKIGDVTKDSNLQQMAMLPTFLPFVDNDALISDSLKKFNLDRPPYNMTVDRFRRKNYLDVRIPKSTRLMELNVEFPDAHLAADIANDLAQGAVQFNDRLNAMDTTATQQFLKKQLDEATKGLARATERRLQVHAEARIEDREKDLTIRLAEKDRLSTRLEQLRLDLTEHESKSKSLQQALAGEPRTILLKKSVTADRFLELAAEKLNPGGAPLSMTEESLNQTREEIQRDFVNASASSAAETAGIQVAAARLEQVNKQISDVLARLTMLRSEIASADQEYMLATEAVKNASREYQTASVTVSSKSQDMKQIAPALVPERPVRPNIFLNTVLSFLLGALIAATIAIVIQSYRGMRRQGALVEEEVEALTVHRN